MTKPDFEFFIPGTLPGRNEQEKAARGNKYAAASMKKKYTKRVKDRIVLKFLGLGAHGFTEKCSVIFYWVEPNRRRDPDNISAGGVKFVFDGMVAAGLLPNDGWNNVKMILHRFKVNKLKPGIYVEVFKEV